jgi:C_GCAxxG_C_C family probable redox protein
MEETGRQLPRLVQARTTIHSKRRLRIDRPGDSKRGIDGMNEFVKSRVAKYYWEDDINCATTTLNILAEHFGVKLHQQVTNAAVGMHGAGEYGAQCGLVEGALMFLGIIGKEKRLADEAVVEACRELAGAFEQRFGSLNCRVLRPQGFKEENPPHLCEPLTCEAIEFSLIFVVDWLERQEMGATGDGS